MKYVILILTLVSIAFSYCSYLYKTGEYASNKYYSYGYTSSNKICIYGNEERHIPVVYFGQLYCPYFIEYDRYRKIICNWN